VGVKNLKNLLATAATAAIMTVAMATAGNASPFTMTSPNGALPGGVTQVGGLVLDLKGTNGNRVVAQVAASTLYVGFANANPLTIGSQTGYTAALAGLGGGLTAASLRVTLEDGDSGPGDFDDGNQNELFVNGFSFGFFDDVATEWTDGLGATIAAGTGFGDSILSTGFFSIANAGDLAALFASLTGTDTATFTLFDIDPYDNFYDFTQGVDGSLINVGTGPVIVPPTNGVPEPITLSLFGAGLAGAVAMRRRRKA